MLCCISIIIVTKFFVEVRTRPRRTAGKYVKVIVVESNVGEDDEWSNDSAVFTGSDVANDARSEGGGGKGDLEDVDILQDEDETSILCIQRNSRENSCHDRH